VTKTLYPNTIENAKKVGYEKLSEHWVGDENASHVIHDTVTGTFTFMDINSIFALIALDKLGLSTLAIQGSDGLDFHELPVWSIKAAMEAAYQAGLKAGGS